MVAEKFGLSYNPSECTHEGDCAGTCPMCDAELLDLQRQLSAKGIRNIDMKPELEKINGSELMDSRDSTPDVLAGIPAPPEIVEDSSQEFVLQGDVPFPKEEKRITITDGMPLPPFIEKKKAQVLFKQCNIAGVTFHDLSDIWDELYEGAQLALVRDKENKHDKYAVAVALAEDYDGDPEGFDFNLILGYIPRGENEYIATMLDMGWTDALGCEISKITGSTPYKGSLQMNIYIVSKEEKDAPDTRALIRTLELDDKEFTSFISDLENNGCVCFRWGGFPPWELNLPKEGDKLVFLHRNVQTTEIYLMHCIAQGDDHAAFFVKDKKMLHAVDDCCFYVFTNVKGPRHVKNEDLSFLINENIPSEQPEVFLSEQATTKLLSLLM